MPLGAGLEGDEVQWARTAWTSSLAERAQTRDFLHEKHRTSPTLDLKLAQRGLAFPTRIVSLAAESSPEILLHSMNGYVLRQTTEPAFLRESVSQGRCRLSCATWCRQGIYEYASPVFIRINFVKCQPNIGTQFTHACKPYSHAIEIMTKTMLTPMSIGGM
jgi:hypothetical protein